MARIEPAILASLHECLKQRLEHMATGATIRYLSRKKFEKFEIDAPSLDEQKRIVAILDKGDEISQNIEQAYDKREMKKSVFLNYWRPNEYIREKDSISGW